MPLHLSNVHWQHFVFLTQYQWVLKALTHSLSHRWTHWSEDKMLPLKCKRCERRTWRYMALNEGSNGGETGSSGRFQFLCRTFFFFFSPSGEMLSVHVRKNQKPKTFSHGAHLSSSHTHATSHISSASPVRMFLIGYKNLNSRYFLLPSSSSSSFFFLLPYSFALKNTFAFFLSLCCSLFLLSFFFFFKF